MKMFGWVRKLMKSRKELIDEELARNDFCQVYLDSNDQGKLFQQRCKIPEGNIFHMEQFRSWSSFMVTFTTYQKLYRKMRKSSNFDESKFAKTAKKEIRKTALAVLN